MKHRKRTEYGMRKPYCKCNCAGYGKESFVVPFTEYFSEVNQRCHVCKSKFFFFTLIPKLKPNIERNLV